MLLCLKVIIVYDKKEVMHLDLDLLRYIAAQVQWMLFRVKEQQYTIKSE